MPKKVQDTYFKDGIRRIDYVIVYEKDIDQRSVGRTLLKATKKQLARRASARMSGYGPAQSRIEYYLKNLENAGLEMEIDEHESEFRTMTAIKLHVTWDALCAQADVLKMKMPTKLRDHYDEEKPATFWDKFWELRFLAQKSDDLAPEAGSHIYWRFDMDHPERFLIPDNRDDFFSPIQRSEIAYEIMEQCQNDVNKKDSRGMEALLEHGVVDSVYPLHQGDYTISDNAPESTYNFRQKLRDQWATFRAIIKPQPINRIRNYFGEKTAFYFAFMQFYTHSLLFPAFFGILAFLYGLISVSTNMKPVLADICNETGKVGSYAMCPICQPPACPPFKMFEEGCPKIRMQYIVDNEATLIVSVLTVIWMALFVKAWRRRQARLSFAWQTYDAFEFPGLIRADYEEKATEEKLDRITGEKRPFIPMAKRAPWIAASISVTISLWVVASACLTGLIVARIKMYGAFRQSDGILKEKNVEAARWIIHLLMILMVFFFEKIYHHIVEKLTVWERHKTNFQFYNSLLWKLFVLSQLVDFLPIAYAAWIKGRSVRTPLDLGPATETCEPGGCMGEVMEIVAVLLGLRLLIGNVKEFVVPALRNFLVRVRGRAPKSGVEESDSNVFWPQWLKDFHLGELEMDGVSKALMEMMIQISFVVFFVPAWTLAPLFCFINNILKLRIDSINFLATHRRKTPRRVPHFETWNVFLDVILKLGVLINAALIAFTSEIIPRLYYKYRVPKSKGTFVGYPEFSMSKLNVADWPQLSAMVNEAKEKLAHTVRESLSNATTQHSKIVRALNAAEEEEEEFLAEMTSCRYFDYRRSSAPYEKTITYWQVIAYRLAAFAIFAIGFYVIIFLIDRLVKDVPTEIEKKIKRHQYIVTKYLEEGKTNRFSLVMNNPNGQSADVRLRNGFKGKMGV